MSTTYNNMVILTCPHYSTPRVVGPSSIQWTNNEAIANTQSPFTGAIKTYDWGASWFSASVSFGQMDRHSYAAWSAFLMACRGGSNAFMLGDPRAVYPQGSALGTPLVNGAQSGYTLSTRGWKASQHGLLLAGDYIQIGYRLYCITQNASSDSSGDSTLDIWPNLRSDNQTDGLSIITRNCKGLFKLKDGGTQTSVNVGLYGINSIQIIEAI
jgi:hypothetical protein